MFESISLDDGVGSSDGFLHIGAPLFINHCSNTADYSIDILRFI